jgi:NAD(P)-dependent dehydrogenase (short-subunit alcohol dehydrogenase family)
MNARYNLAGKTLLVTGAATGIGRATASLLLEQGASVFGLGLDGDEAREHVVPNLLFMDTDVRRDDEVRTAVAACVDAFGGLDGVVNAAAIYETGKRLEELSDVEWERTLDVNLSGIFRVCRAALPIIRHSGGGSIVNIASVHATATVAGVPAYAASKGGVVALSRQMALDYARDGIRVNSLLVGSVDTRMTRPALEAAGGAEAVGLSWNPRALPRIASADEVAATIAFLLSDAASLITGSAVTADAGMTALLF